MADLTTLLNKFLASLYGGTLYSNPFGATSVGVPVIQATGRATAQTAAVASVATYTPAADGSFEVGGNVVVTTYASGSFNEQVTWTDESNTSRTVNLLSSYATNVFAVNIASQNYYAMATIAIRAKAGTAITVLTSGTFTSLTYNVEGFIRQIA